MACRPLQLQLWNLRPLSGFQRYLHNLSCLSVCFSPPPPPHTHMCKINPFKSTIMRKLKPSEMILSRLTDIQDDEAARSCYREADSFLLTNTQWHSCLVQETQIFIKTTFIKTTSIFTCFPSSTTYCNLFWKYFWIFYMYKWLPECVCIPHVCSAQRPEDDTRFPELEL